MIETYARQTAAALRLPIHADDWPSVLANMETLFAVAATLLAESIGDYGAPAPVFEA